MNVELMLAEADTFVDLGPGTVTIIFGRDEEKVEEQCHTFPLAAHSPVFRKMLTVDMLEKASGRVELPHISHATGRQCSELFSFLLNYHCRIGTRINKISEKVIYFIYNVYFPI
jgi:hypothetical protein